MNPEVLEYARAELRDGKSPEQITQNLVATGWSRADADQIVRAAIVGARPVMAPQTPPPPPAAPTAPQGPGAPVPGTPAQAMPPMPGQLPGAATTSGWSIGPGGFRFGVRRPMSPTGAKILGIIFVLVGGSFAFFGVNQYFAAKHLADVGVKVPGTVIRIDQKTETSHDSNGTHTSTTYRPVVSYALQDGEEKEYASNTWRSPNPFKVGQTVEMIYDPVDASKVAINTAGEMYLMPLLMAGFGLIFVIAGLIAFIQSLKRRG